MQPTFVQLCLLLLFAIGCDNLPNGTLTCPAAPRHEYAMVIHGGAGTITKDLMTPEKEKAYTEALDSALQIGAQILSEGGSCMDAVERTIRFMEDCPLFNSGRGAVFTADGENELDASIMDGATMNAGAVSGVKTVRHPISAARKVMTESKHVMLSGAGADEFAGMQNLELVDPDFFYTPRRWNSLEKARENERRERLGSDFGRHLAEEHKYGTVGAVALDRMGNLAAGTSTGGMTNKRFNRIGDSPIIGAGTYANNSTCGVSCTGHGEYFIRYAVAHDVSAMMEYQKLPLQEAADKVINKKLKLAGGSGGLVALDSMGNPAMPFNTSGMYRGYVNPDTSFTRIYSD